ncbi:MAG: hypothetical protein M1829_001875 [Trizodia sp. TS-e1964]|nr:MAG: hypothetical protein M1829_001875 [Trizodia sp. TS-e1964]
MLWRAWAYPQRETTGTDSLLPKSHHNQSNCLLNRLLDYRAQEKYYGLIVERYMKFCAASGSGLELERQFASLSLSLSKSPANKSSPALLPSKPASSVSAERDVHLSQDKELTMLHLSLRKLREGLLASSRIDAFSTQAYMFSIRATILTKQPTAYRPALLYLLFSIHPRCPLSAPEYHEFSTYLILDLACRMQDLGGAFAVRRRCGLRDRRVDAVLRALVHDHWWLFWRMKRGVDGYQARLMEWADEAVRVHALKCLGRAYMKVEVEYLEKVAGGRVWEELTKVNGVGWEKGADGMVVIRRARGS